MNYYLAIDLGASGGRHILGHIENGKYVTEEVYRFENSVKKCSNHLVWDTEEIFENILSGISACKKAGKEPKTLAIDTWGLDFVLLDKNGALCAETVAYRDHRTDGMFETQARLISDSELYSVNGTQKQQFNSLYHLLAIKAESPESLQNAERFLMIPEYFNYLLTGKAVSEYTNATTTGLVNAATKTWDVPLIRKLGLPEKIFFPLSVPGTTVGKFSEKVRSRVGFDCEVILTATHDTASAFLAVPARDDKAVYISSGTWSLLGVEKDMPETSEESRVANFTNEGGYLYRYRYLKNIMGLWMIQNIRRDTQKKYSYAELEAMARNCSYFKTEVDVDDSCFLAPENMTEEIKEWCRRHSQTEPESIGEVMQCVYLSLAKSYASAIEQLSDITGIEYTSVNIVGGGSRDSYLNSLTAAACGLPVFAGPTEGTALGNLIVQFITAGEIRNLIAARKMILNSYEIEEIQP